MRSLKFAGLLAGVALAATSPAHAQDVDAGAEAPAPEAQAEAGPEAEAQAGAEAEAQAGAEAEAEAEASYDADTVLATVDGVEITLGHVVVLRERLPEQFQALPDETLLEGLIGQVVDQELLARSVSETPEEDPLSVRLHVENERRGALAQQAVVEYLEADVDDEAVQEAYDEAFAEFDGTEWNASHILVESEDEARALREEIEAGADFAELAREHSIEPGAAERAGDLGWFEPGRMVPEFEQALADMEVGEVSEPVQTQFGWHIIRLEETRDQAPPALDAVRPQVVDQLRQQRLGAELEALRAGAEIERPETDIPAAAVRDTSIIEN